MTLAWMLYRDAVDYAGVPSANLSVLELRPRCPRRISAGRRLRRPDSQRRETARPAGGGVAVKSDTVVSQPTRPCRQAQCPRIQFPPLQKQHTFGFPPGL